ncbi:hypothetical protein GY45DRAFT_1070594 [Cubamyces sp. BRFM 1775]|nr:hypothetical protein GY45DRAFT_1070594 [Cubamyces sp. BRFM 1775]
MLWVFIGGMYGIRQRHGALRSHRILPTLAPLSWSPRICNRMGFLSLPRCITNCLNYHLHHRSSPTYDVTTSPMRRGSLFQWYGRAARPNAITVSRVRNGLGLWQVPSRFREDRPGSKNRAGLCWTQGRGHTGPLYSLPFTAAGHFAALGVCRGVWDAQELVGCGTGQPTSVLVSSVLSLRLFRVGNVGSLEALCGDAVGGRGSVALALAISR